MKSAIILVLSIVFHLFAEPISKGEKAPDFSLIDGNGIKHSLSTNIGTKATILVFYPGDNTPVCTKQLCELRDSYDTLMTFDSLSVYGINDGSQESHKYFSQAQNYQFPLLVDNNWSVAEKYGIKGGIIGVKRFVFIIDKNGIVQFAKKGKPPISSILEVLESL